MGDRVIGAAAVGVLGAVLLGAVALASAPAPTVPAAGDLVALMQRGERATYVAEYRFDRVLSNGQRLPSTDYVARRPRSHVERSGNSLTIEYPDQSYDCTLATSGPSCFVRTRPATLPDSEVVRLAVARGFYAVARSPAATIAGERAECFRVRPRPRRGVLPGLGAESDLCFATDGVPLRNWRLSDHLDQLDATKVTRQFDATTLAPLFAGFEQAAPAAPR